MIWEWIFAERFWNCNLLVNMFLGEVICDAAENRTKCELQKELKCVCFATEIHKKQLQRYNCTSDSNLNPDLLSLSSCSPGKWQFLYNSSSVLNLTRNALGKGHWTANSDNLTYGFGWNIVASQNGLGRKWHWRSSCSNPMPWAGTPSTRPWIFPRIGSSQAL